MNCVQQPDVDEVNPAFCHIPAVSSIHDSHSEMVDEVSDQAIAISEKLNRTPKTTTSSVEALSVEKSITEEISPIFKERKDDERNDPELSSSRNESSSIRASTQSFKRYVLIKRLNANAAHVMHVWGPTMKDPIIPVRRVADDQNQKASNTHSYQVKKIFKSE